MDYTSRRARLLQQIGPDAVMIVYAAPIAYRSGHSEYAYRQDSDFYYLTGFSESEAVLLLDPHSQTPTTLFCKENDPKMARWTGSRLGPAMAMAQLHVDAAFSIDTIDIEMPKLLSHKKIIYYPMGRHSCDEKMIQWIKHARENTRYMAMPNLADVQQMIAPMRLIKDAAEIQMMQKAADIAAQAHLHGMKKVRPDLWEYQLAGEYIYQFTQQGAKDIAYLPIVGGGKNACVLHYVANQDKLRDGDLVLVDAGCEYQNYCSDVSRTFPVNGRFNTEQRALYDVVLMAYVEGLAQIKPGNDWPCVQKKVKTVLTEGLKELGLLADETRLSDFFMHSPGHWLGLDVHDVGAYQTNHQATVFAPGMVVTLEPGLYVSPQDGLDKKWWHIGIRIEDDILITEKNHQVLSQAAPILPDDIEQVMR